MRVLLIVTDLYASIGGGETVYRKIVHSAPDIEFYYLVENEPADAQRPKNVTPVKLQPRRPIEILSPPPVTSYRHVALQNADRIALSVEGMSFDIVDVPDYVTLGDTLRDAFALHSVHVKRIVLAMHGNISTSIDMQWEANTGSLEQRLLEREQFKRADHVYGISERYIAEWQNQIDRAVQYVDPLCFVDFAPPSQLDTVWKTDNQKPSLYCVGRTERRKGNDIFVEMIRWLNADLYQEAAHVGAKVYTQDGLCSEEILRKLAENRGLPVANLGAKNRQELTTLLGHKNMIILPVRYDTLNLVALETIFSGCPVAVSTKAGVCDYLDKYFPSLPYTKIDFGAFQSSISAIEKVLSNYDDYRENLGKRLRALNPAPAAVLNIRTVYDTACISPGIAGFAVETHAVHLNHQYRPASYSSLRSIYRNARLFAYKKRRELRKYYWSIRFGDSALSARYFIDALRIPNRLKGISRAPENNQEHLKNKLISLYNLCCNPIFRCNFWRDIARVEEIRQNDMYAVTYDLRILRLLGKDIFGKLPTVVSTLCRLGFRHEAEAAEALYANPPQSEERVLNFLKAAQERNRILPAGQFERKEDHRQGDPRVSVIVSMYKAASKLKFFIDAIQKQSLIQGDTASVEFIFVDSGSPTNEYEVFSEYIATHPLNALYLRSQVRETIQAAWNRGIKHAKAPYLVFLGVDETLYPDALQKLADSLDRDPSTDWVMANSLITEVDERGVYKNDVMTYNRNGATRDFCYLETCYISWVGGMYRKSVHEKFGYYDETFRAAGDTEFKNRVLPFIKVSFLAETLGLFLNYPEERTTASSLAEIEDLRAWYIHRSPGGIRYAFDNRTPEDVAALMRAALGYRKSFCGHLSSDIEYASYLADYLNKQQSNSLQTLTINKDLKHMLVIQRSLEILLKPTSPLSCMKIIADAYSTFSCYQKSHLEILRGQASPSYGLLNDNRYEQHSWLWKST